MQTFTFPRRTASLALLAAITLALAVPAHAQTVTNGGFEDSTSADGHFTGWTLSGNADFTSANPNTFVFGNPHSGDFAAWLGPSSSDGFLSQTLATTVGQTYTLTYWLAVDTSNLTFAAANGNAEPAVFNDFITSFNGQTVFTQNNLAPTDSHTNPADDYTQFSFSTVATSTSTPLQFGFRNDNSEFRLDDVSVANTTAPVPEPSTLVSLAVLLSLTGAVVVARRRKALKA